MCIDAGSGLNLEPGRISTVFQCADDRGMNSVQEACSLSDLDRVQFIDSTHWYRTGLACHARRY